MKFFPFFFLLISYNAFSQVDTTSFITTWKTNNTELEDTTSITIPIATDELYNYEVDWNNDGIFDESGITGSVTHDYGTVGEYTIRIRGVFPRILFLASDDRFKILSIDQWGTIEWSSMEKAFSGAQNLTLNATDAPDLSQVESLNAMFRSAWNFDGEIGHWDLSNVTDISFMFYSAISFNGDIGAWDVSQVTNMRACFFQANNFNAEIGNWDVSNVRDMTSMFYTANMFNGDIGGWDVGNVEDMFDMFVFARAFNQDLSEWDVSQVTDMTRMFYDAELFNANLCNWDVSQVTNMSGMFREAAVFNGDISCWDVSQVTEMQGMFTDATAFNADISAWNTGQVKFMGSMFERATSFNQNLGEWPIGEVKNMNRMLYESGMSIENYDATLIGWSNATIIPDEITLGAKDLEYCEGETARQFLIDNYEWEIEEDAINCPPVSTTDLEQLELNIFPNPTTELIHLSLQNPNLEKVEITLFDGLGRILENRALQRGISEIQEGFMIKNSGVYFFNIKIEKGMLIRKIVVE